MLDKKEILKWLEERKVPKLYETDDVSTKDKLIYGVFHLGVLSRWYISEVNTQGDDADLCFGFVILNGDEQCSEWGYFSIDELIELSEDHKVVFDFNWEPKPTTQCPFIKTWGKEVYAD